HEQAGKQIVYLDESGFEQSMPRTHGYSLKGSRCFGLHDWQHKGRVNVMGAIIKNTFVTLSVFGGNINADVFHAWMTQDLLPKLPKNAVIVMDNASFHKRCDTLKAITEHGCQLEWLPPYSPDLNPIEHK
ncbi:IS630 family transposase, partial [Xenorhabdus doucetiae]|uniref:IS630 family transposase n=1 Tax=Xenorhabdus doucetiae TaxID=351671 RepID=UPI002B410BAF